MVESRFFMDSKFVLGDISPVMFLVKTKSSVLSPSSLEVVHGDGLFFFDQAFSSALMECQRFFSF